MREANSVAMRRSVKPRTDDTEEGFSTLRIDPPLPASHPPYQNTQQQLPQLNKTFSASSTSSSSSSSPLSLQKRWSRVKASHCYLLLVALTFFTMMIFAHRSHGRAERAVTTREFIVDKDLRTATVDLPIDGSSVKDEEQQMHRATSGRKGKSRKILAGRKVDHDGRQVLGGRPNKEQKLYEQYIKEQAKIIAEEAEKRKKQQEAEAEQKRLRDLELERRREDDMNNEEQEKSTSPRLLQEVTAAPPKTLASWDNGGESGVHDNRALDDEHHIKKKKKKKGKKTKHVDNYNSGVPRLMYCLPNGGFNDICVQAWRCVEHCLKYNRTLVMGYENYIPSLPPYEEYFKLKPIPGLKAMSQEEAAQALERLPPGDIDVYPSKVPLGYLLGKDAEGREERQKGQKIFVRAERLLNFNFENTTDHEELVAVYHKKGNKGDGDETLRHLIFSDEIKETFLKRWGQLRKPYIGIHIRGTDRRCGDTKQEQVLKKLVKLGSKKRLKGAQIYLATDNPKIPDEFTEELEDKQLREIIAFTYHPTFDEGHTEFSDGLYRPPAEKKKKIQEPTPPPPLHLNKNLTDKQKHITNVDGFVDLLLLGFSDTFVTSCGGYTRLAKALHGNKEMALGLIGEELQAGQTDYNQVLEAALRKYTDVGDRQKELSDVMESL